MTTSNKERAPRRSIGQVTFEGENANLLMEGHLEATIRVGMSVRLKASKASAKETPVRTVQRWDPERIYLHTESPGPHQVKVAVMTWRSFAVNYEAVLVPAPTVDVGPQPDDGMRPVLAAESEYQRPLADSGGLIPIDPERLAAAAPPEARPTPHGEGLDLDADIRTMVEGDLDARARLWETRLRGQEQDGPFEPGVRIELGMDPAREVADVITGLRMRGAPPAEHALTSDALDEVVQRGIRALIRQTADEVGAGSTDEKGKPRRPALDRLLARFDNLTMAIGKLTDAVWAGGQAVRRLQPTIEVTQGRSPLVDAGSDGPTPSPSHRAVTHADGVSAPSPAAPNGWPGAPVPSPGGP